MRITPAVTVLAAACLSLTACGSSGAPDEKEGSTPPAASAPPTPPEVKALALGKTAHTAGAAHPVEGDGGGVLDITPTSVVYVPTGTGQTPVNGSYAVVAYKAKSATAVAAAETVPAENAGWQWIAPDGQAVSTMDGDATSVTPDGFLGSGAVALGSYQWRSQAFDLTKAQHGGQLVYTDGEGKTYRWTMPAKDSGPEAAKLKKALAG
ncbi:hypothetical protein [Streptomyces sp. Ac-502]|uniref:hypothetical protein n=1 Tax=Streptomyces sp. Ac-502 TaxID=3342801 RepID=UPI0038623EDE